jgi:DNA-binding Lrp family transcriptional regulator
MQRIKLDQIDRRILAELQDDGRMTNVELSKRAQISAPPCLRRVRALEEAGFIRGYHAELDPKLMGYEVHAYAMVGLTSQAEVDLRAFEAQVAQWPIVRECTMLAGEVDYILKCVAHSLEEWQSFVTQHLTRASHVASVKTSLALRVVKRAPGVPVDSV